MAVIRVTPLMDITAFIASEHVNEGDVLLLEEGIYFQTVNISKNHIRIVAKGPEIIFDGKGILLTAFRLSDVVGVAIEGIKIRYYRDDSIIIQSGSSNRIVNNTFYNMLSDGIVLISSSGNLIWKNEICNCSDGIKLSSGSTHNWVIENIVRDGFVDGFEALSAADSNNAFISNIAIRNRDFGFKILGSNNLLLDNLSINNTQGIWFSEGNNSLAIGNKIKGSKSSALTVFNNFRNCFVGGNYIECNEREGIANRGDFGMFLNNGLSYNGDKGIVLDTVSVGNLVMDNKLVCNVPENIGDGGTNNLVNNLDKPCEPGESPGDVCGSCFDEEEIKTEFCAGPGGQSLAVDKISVGCQRRTPFCVIEFRPLNHSSLST